MFDASKCYVTKSYIALLLQTHEMQEFVHANFLQGANSVM